MWLICRRHNRNLFKHVTCILNLILLKSAQKLSTFCSLIGQTHQTIGLKFPRAHQPHVGPKKTKNRLRWNCAEVYFGILPLKLAYSCTHMSVLSHPLLTVCSSDTSASSVKEQSTWLAHAQIMVESGLKHVSLQMEFVLMKFTWDDFIQFGNSAENLLDWKQIGQWGSAHSAKWKHGSMLSGNYQTGSGFQEKWRCRIDSENKKTSYWRIPRKQTNRTTVLCIDFLQIWNMIRGWSLGHK